MRQGDEQAADPHEGGVGRWVAGEQVVVLAHGSGQWVPVVALATAASGLVITPFLAASCSVPGRQVITHAPTGRHVVATPSGHQGVAIADVRLLLGIAERLVAAGFGDWTAVDPASALPRVREAWQRAVDAEYLARGGA